MDKNQEKVITNKIQLEMTKLRNNSVATGMRAAMGAILGICKKENKTAEEKLEEIMMYCEMGIKN